MKITIDIELAENEANHASQMVEVLQQYCSNVTAKVHTDKAQLTQLIREGITSNKVDYLVTELARRLNTPHLSADCMNVLMSIIFDAKRVQNNESPVPYLNLYNRLPEPQRTRVRDEMMARCLKYLTVPRSIDAPREEILPYGEALGGLIKSDTISARGTIAALTQLVQDENTRCAGITSLGKVIELASDVVVERCDSATLEQLRSTLSAAQNDVFLYDIEYITEPLGWNTQHGGHHTTHSALRGPGSLSVTKSCRYHTTPILAMAYNPSTRAGEREVVVTSSVDGVIGTWSPRGDLLTRCMLAQHYACSLDLASKGHVMLVSGLGRNRTGGQSSSSAPPAVVYYQDDNDHWVEKGAMEPKGTRVISCVKSIRSTSNQLQFATGEAGSSGGIVLSIYDVAHGNTPLKQVREHADVITTLYTPTDRDDLLLSGSRDYTVLLHDVRLSHTAAPQVLAQHGGTVASISGFGEYIVTGGFDKRVYVTDLRMLQQPVMQRDFDSAVLKVGLGQQMYCAVGTQTSIYTLNLHATSHPTKAEGSTGRYYDFRWNAGQSILYAGGESGTVDMFAVTS